MATQTKKKSAASSKTGGNRRSKTQAKHKNHPSKDSGLSMVQYEIAVMLILAASLFVMISIYFKSGGIIGEYVRLFFFGVFGFAAWIMPIGIFAAAVLKIANRHNERLDIKILLSFLVIAFISVTSHVFYVDIPQMDIFLKDDWAIFASLANYYDVSANYQVGGGFIGALIGDLLILFVGRIGTFVVLAVIFISLFVAITEQSFIMIAKKLLDLLVVGLKKFMNFIGDKSEAHQEALQKRKKEEEEKKNQAMSDNKIRNIKIDNEGPKDKTKKGNFIASLLKSTIVKEEDDYDIVKHIEEQEAREERVKEESYTRLFDESSAKIEEGKSHKNDSSSSKVLWTENQPSTKIMDQGSLFEEQLKSVEVDEKSTKISKQDLEKGKKVIEQEILHDLDVVEKVYQKPPIELLHNNPDLGKSGNASSLDDNARKLEETLASFGVGAKVIDVAMGPSVTRYELQPDQGVKVSKIVNLADDIALNLAANGIRIEAPIPGKSAVGIEVPNKDVKSVFLREVLDTDEFEHFPSSVAFGLGKDISGKVIVTDIARMPHLLIAGATGSGKSVCVNTLITSILYKSSPDDVKLLMIDPKVVELSIYNGIPHLLIPVVTEPKKAASALNWAVQEMLERYKLFAAANVRDIKGYNKAVLTNEDGLKKLPQIVIIVDELADLMVAAAGEVEEAICRLAQMARAAGLHLIIATQRPSVDVITGLIKANIPSRIAFNVSSGTDSRTIIDMNGAEKLLGKGDMLFYPVGLQKPVRIQGAFVTDKEVENIVSFLKTKKKEEYDQKIMMQLDKAVSEKNAPSSDYDEIFEDVLDHIVDKQKASASMIQRRFRVGYNRAARILDQLYDAGYVGEEEGSKPRKVLLTKDDLIALKEKANGPVDNEDHTNESNHEAKDKSPGEAVTEDERPTSL